MRIMGGLVDLQLIRTEPDVVMPASDYFADC